MTDEHAEFSGSLTRAFTQCRGVAQGSKGSLDKRSARPAFNFPSHRKRFLPTEFTRIFNLRKCHKKSGPGWAKIKNVYQSLLGSRDPGVARWVELEPEEKIGCDMVNGKGPNRRLIPPRPGEGYGIRHSRDLRNHAMMIESGLQRDIQLDRARSDSRRWPIY